MDEKKEKIEIEEIEKEEKECEAYPEEMLIACQNGKPCSYGICDECPNTLGNGKDKEDDQD